MMGERESVGAHPCLCCSEIKYISDELFLSVDHDDIVCCVSSLLPIVTTPLNNCVGSVECFAWRSIGQTGNNMRWHESISVTIRYAVCFFSSLLCHAPRAYFLQKISRRAGREREKGRGERMCKGSASEIERVSSHICTIIHTHAYS